MSAPTFHDALVDPRLFGRQFGGPSWAAWRVIAKAIDGVPLDPPEQAIFGELTGRTRAPSRPVDEVTAIKGRRAGGSIVLGAARAVHAAVFGDFARRLAPGERATIMLLAADRKQARTLMRYCAGLIDETPLLAGLVEGRTQDAIALSTRATIEIHTSSFRSVRGYSIALAVCDELAFWEGDEASANPAEEVLTALRPALASLGGQLICLSSPYGRKGPLWETYARRFGQDDDRVLVIRGTTQQLNPTIDPRIIERSLEEDEAAARAEWLAEFRQDIDSPFSREAIDAVTPTGRRELPPRSDREYVAFVDPSGGSSDSMTLAVAHVEIRDEQPVSVLDLVREARPPFSPEATAKDFAAAVKPYRIEQVVGDAYGGEWPREQFRKRGIDYVLSPAPKADLYRDLVPVVNSRRVELLDDARLRSQIVGLERRTGRGRDVFDHGPHGHDDVVNAAAGALVTAIQQGADVMPLMLLGGSASAEWEAQHGYASEASEEAEADGDTDADDTQGFADSLRSMTTSLVEKFSALALTERRQPEAEAPVSMAPPMSEEQVAASKAEEKRVERARKRLARQDAAQAAAERRAAEASTPFEQMVKRTRVWFPTDVWRRD